MGEILSFEAYYNKNRGPIILAPNEGRGYEADPRAGDQKPDEPRMPQPQEEEKTNEKLYINMPTEKKAQKHNRRGLKNDILPVMPFGNSELIPEQKINHVYHFSMDGYETDFNTGEYDLSSGAIVNSVTGEEICPQIVLPAHVDTMMETSSQKIEIVFNDEGEWKCAAVLPASEAFKPASIAKMADYGVVVYGTYARKLSEFLFDVYKWNRKLIGRADVVHEIGWNDGCDTFVPYDSHMRFEHTGNDEEVNAVCSVEQGIEEWTALIRPIRAMRKIPFRILMAGSFASVLVKPMGNLPFFINIWSHGSGTGKTASLVAASSIWGKPGKDDGYIKSFKATPTALMETAAFFCDLPLIIDELQTIENKKNFNDYIYNLAEGQTSVRAKGAGGFRKQYHWHNTILVSGEMPIVVSTTKAGGVNRVIEVEAKESIIYDDALAMHDLCENLERCYGSAGRAFVECLSQADNMEHAREVYRQFLFELQGKATGKQASSAALILTADTLSDEWIFQDGIRLTTEDILPVLKTEEDVDRNELAHECLVDWIDRNRPHFGDYSDPACTKVRSAVYGRFMLDGDRKVCAIRPRMIEEALERKKYNVSSYRSWAAENGKIYTGNDSAGVMRTDKIVKLPELGKMKPQRCVLIYIDDEQDAG